MRRGSGQLRPGEPRGFRSSDARLFRSTHSLNTRTRTVRSMSRRIAIPDFLGPEPTPEELAHRKQVSDRAALLSHVDYIIRPPAWMYEEMEEAIRHALAGSRTTKIESRDGAEYLVADLLERWELADLLEIYARPPDDPSYCYSLGL